MCLRANCSQIKILNEGSSFGPVSIEQLGLLIRFRKKGAADLDSETFEQILRVIAELNYLVDTKTL